MRRGTDGSRAVVPLGLLAAAAFLSSGGARVIDPLLHAIATDFATTVPAVSIVVAAFTLPYGLCQILLGPLGDSIGKLRVILGALVAYAVATGACALATDLPMLTLLRVAAGAASAAVIPLGMAYIGDGVPYAQRQVTLSRFLNGSMLALVMAGPVGGVFGEYVGWRGVFLLLAAAALVLAAALARRLPSLPDPRGHGERMSLATFFSLAQRPAARALLLCATLDGALLLGCFPFLAPYLHERFDLSYASVGLILSCFGLGALAYTRVVRWLVPQLGEANLLLAGGLVMSAALAAGMAAPHWAWFIPVQFALGFGFYLLHGVMQVRATEMLPQARATAVSAFAFMLFMGQSLGALAIGATIARLGYHDAFLIQAACILAFGLALRVLMRRGAG